MTKEEFLNFANAIESLEVDRKDAATEIKEKIETFSEQISVPKKVVRKAVKAYLKFKEDQAGYLEEESVLDNILKTVISKEGE